MVLKAADSEVPTTYAMNPKPLKMIEISLVVAPGVYPILVCSVEATGLAGPPMNVVLCLVVVRAAAVEGGAKCLKAGAY